MTSVIVIVCWLGAGSQPGQMFNSLSWLQLFRSSFMTKHVEIPDVGDVLVSCNLSATEDCSSLVSVTLPASLTHIHDCAFSGCSTLEVVHVEEGLSYLGHYTFAGCSRLSSFKLPSSVTYIGDSAFKGCDLLEQNMCAFWCCCRWCWFRQALPHHQLWARNPMGRNCLLFRLLNEYCYTIYGCISMMGQDLR